MEDRRFRQLLLSRDSLCLLAIILLADALLLIIAALDYYPRIVNVDGLYSAEVARNLLRGKGYTTSEMTLYEVNLYFQKGWLQLGPPWNNAGRFPLPVLIRAAVFALVGNNYLAATYLYSMSFQVISVVAVFVVSLYLFREELTAFFSGLLFAASPILIFSGINGKETTSDYALFMIFLGLVYLWRRRTQPKLSLVLVLGLIVGITYLNRFNLGGVALLTLIPLTVKDALSRKVQLSRISKMIVSFAAGFGLIIAPLAIYNTFTFGNPIFSSNSLFQLVQFTRPVKYMNPWWKLSYPFDTANPVSALNMFSGDIISRTLSVMAGSLNDFLAMGQVGAGYTWFWWIPVGVSAIAGIWPRLSKGIGFPSTTSEQLRAQGLVWYLLLSNLLLDLPILGIFSAGVEYIWYLYSIIALLAGFGLTRIIRLIQMESPGIVQALNLRGKSQSLGKWMTNLRMGLVAFCILSLGGVFSLGQLPASPGLNEAELQLLALFVVIPLAIALFKYRRALLPLAFIFLVLAVPAVRYGIIGANGTPEIVPSWITDQNAGIFQLISGITTPDGVVLSAEPWNIVWYSDRPSVAFSEFPDEIYLLMAKYHLNIQAVYIANLNSVFYRDVHAPYTYDSYRRIAIYNYTLSGFEPVKQGFSGGEASTLLLRNKSFDPTTLLDTQEIDFGNSTNATHLVWGWSQIVDLNGTKAAWAVWPGGLNPSEDPRFGLSTCPVGFQHVDERCLPAVTYIINGQTLNASYPSAETTFLSSSNPPRTLELKVLSQIPNQQITIVLNSNLPYYGQAGTLLGTYAIPRVGTWVSLNVTIPTGVVNNGLNLVSFIFPSQSPCPGSLGFDKECSLLFNELRFIA